MSGGDEVGRGCPAPGAGAGLGDGPPTGANLTHWLHGCSSPKFVSGNAPNESRMKNASLSRFALGSFFVFVFFLLPPSPCSLIGLVSGMGRLHMPRASVGKCEVGHSGLPLTQRIWPMKVEKKKVVKRREAEEECYIHGAGGGNVLVFFFDRNAFLVPSSEGSQSGGRSAIKFSE